MAPREAIARISLAIAIVLAVVGDARAGGVHRRIVTPRGPVHLWTPDGYDPQTAVVVVYLHGYYITADRAWRSHALARQFAASNINALFVVCATPDGPRRAVAWSSLADLLSAIGRTTTVPEGRRIAVAHSGGHRTVTPWLRDPELDTVVLLDALYNEERQYREWILEVPTRRLIDLAVLTRSWSDRLHASLDESVTYRESARPDDATQERIVYVRSKRAHMELVTGGVVIPWVLQMLQAPSLDAATPLP